MAGLIYVYTKAKLGNSMTGGGDANAFFLQFFSHLSCLQFPFIMAIHGQVCVTCTTLTGGGGGANALICIACFAVSTWTPPPVNELDTEQQGNGLEHPPPPFPDH